jgi:hypothetical protein
MSGMLSTTLGRRKTLNPRPTLYNLSLPKSELEKAEK